MSNHSDSPPISPPQASSEFSDYLVFNPESMLRTILLAALLGAVAFLGYSLLAFTDNTRRMLIILPFTGALAALLILLRRGHINLANHLFAILVWLVVSGAAVTGGGVKSAAFSVYFVVVMLGALLINSRFGVVMALLSAISGLVMTIFAMAIEMRFPFVRYDEVGLWVIQTIVIMLSALIVHLANQRTNHALALSRRNEAYYRGLFQSSLDAIFLVNPAGQIVDANCSAVGMSGYDLSEMQQIDVSTLLQRVPWYSASDNGIGDRRFERSLQRQNGEQLQVEVVVAPLVLEDDVELNMCLVRDITERKDAEMALQQQEKQWRLLTKASPGIIFQADVAGNAVYVNEERWHAFTGLAAGSWRGSGWSNPIHPADRAETLASWQDAVANRTVWQAEFRWLHTDGSYRWLLAQALPITDDDEAFAGFIGTAADVTELKANEALLSTVFANLPFDLWTLDSAGRCTLQNPVSTKIWGDRVGKEIESQSVPRTTLAHWQRANRRALAGELVTGETNYEIGGENRAIEYVLAPISEEGSITGILGINIDITDRKQDEEALRAHKEELESLVATRTAELREIVDLMSGREIRMAELKETIWQLRVQLESAGVRPQFDDPLATQQDL